MKALFFGALAGVLAFLIVRGVISVVNDPDFQRWF